MKVSKIISKSQNDDILAFRVNAFDFFSLSFCVSNYSLPIRKFDYPPKHYCD